MIRMPSSRSFPPTMRQQGIVLITALMFLIVLTLLVLTLMRTTILEERMAGYSRDWNLAFQAAESALREAEREIKAGSAISGQTGFALGCSTSATVGGKGPGLCLPNPCTETNPGDAGYDCMPVWWDLEKHSSSAKHDAAWIDGTSTGTRTRPYNYSNNALLLPGVAAQPRYIIEVLLNPDAGSLKVGQSSNKYLYRATAVGFGANPRTRVVLQGTFRQY